jgi:hypothetical protein
MDQQIYSVAATVLEFEVLMPPTIARLLVLLELLLYHLETLPLYPQSEHPRHTPPLHYL